MAHDQQGDVLIRSLDGSCLLSETPVKRVEIPGDNGKMRLLGDTYSDRPCGAASHQPSTVSHPCQRNHSSQTRLLRLPTEEGGMPCDALRGAQRVINEGYTYVVDLDRRNASSTP
ncbi:MAG: hypothetical protein ACLTOV_03730 [Phocaeicola sp.]